MLQTRRSSSYFASSPTSISMTLKCRNGYNVPSGVSGYTPGQICYFPNDSKYLCGSVKPLKASVVPRLPLMDKWFITSKKPPESRWRLIYIAGCNLGARSQPALAVFLPAASQTYATVRPSGFSARICCKWRFVSVTQPHRGFGEKCHSTVQREAKNGCVINILPKFQVHFFSFFTEGCLGAAFLSALARYFLRLTVSSALALLTKLENGKHSCYIDIISRIQRIYVESCSAHFFV